MRKKVSIFVAGAQALKPERNGLKALAQELNTRYNEQGVDVFVEMKSYEEFKDSQNEYENYIRRSADMTLFVLDSCIGDYTKREFVTAVEAYKQKQIPEIVVFLKNYDKETDEIHKIQDLLKDHMGNHFFYVGYDDVDDLKFKAEKRITRYITPTDHIRSMKIWRMTSFCIAVLAALIGVYALFSYNKKQTPDYSWNHEEPMLLFLGGGSVAKYLETKDSVNVENMPDIPNTIYMGVPTGDLWNMLGEEFYKSNDIATQHFYPIFLAASPIELETTKKAISQNCELKQNILIFELYVGNDTIKTYVENNLFRDYPYQSEINGNCLDSLQLCHLIRFALKSHALYTTSPNSGTLRAYHNVVYPSLDLKGIVSDTTTIHKVFNERTKLGQNSEFVLLGSDNYYPNDMKSETSYKEFCIKDSSDNIVYKKLYLYFVGYREPNDVPKATVKYRIPKQVVNFLAKLPIQGPCWSMTADNEQFAIVQLKGDTVPNEGVVYLRMRNEE